MEPNHNQGYADVEECFIELTLDEMNQVAGGAGHDSISITMHMDVASPS